ncbi:helix-turn-helix transcriptional regulator [Nocardioides sp. W3-2-3]|uniref:helix-turn-helix domain-containing protein n=1 Tax=Nocardioides convexus TaxID=2712224 RepID=UPI0024183A15|nr:helix-turn-helix transcriptional regulator [Nocardioides convexus]NHA00593.1 helix-turn-helix transcriptional regulator [Nocardioides convexus]
MDVDLAGLSRTIDPAELGRRIRASRVAAGLTQSELADGTVTAAYVSRIERGQRRPAANLLEALAARMGTTGHQPADRLLHPRGPLAGAADRARGDRPHPRRRREGAVDGRRRARGRGHLPRRRAARHRPASPRRGPAGPRPSRRGHRDPGEARRRTQPGHEHPALPHHPVQLLRRPRRARSRDRDR